MHSVLVATCHVYWGIVVLDVQSDHLIFKNGNELVAENGIKHQEIY